MKRILIFSMSFVLCVSFNSHAAQTAQARLFCLSLRFQRGTDMFGLSVLDLSTISLDAPNGELAPTFGTPSQFSLFRLSEPDTGDVIAQGEIDLNTPDFADVNGDGFDDFFDGSQAVSGVSVGTYATVIDDGTVRATWSRAAGSKDGTCVLSLRSSMVGPLGDFTHTFELLEYTGPLNYTPGTNKVSGTVNLTQTGDPASKLAGPIEFTKSPTNRFNKLTLQNEVWTNASAQTFNVTNDIPSFERDTALKTNYFGLVDFVDGDPNTADSDYFLWFLAIDDTNDADKDGIPDFSDDPGPIVDRLPLLSLSLGSTNLVLSIRPGLGNVYELQRVDSLSQTNWTVVLPSLTVTNDPQTVVLPLPTNAASFWRVRAL